MPTGTDLEQEPASGRPNRDGFTLARRALVATSVVVSVLLGLFLLWYAVDLLLLVFAGTLFSILLRRFTEFLRRGTGWGRGPSLAIVTLGLFAAIGLAGWLVASRIESQAEQLLNELQSGVETLSQRLENYGWAQQAIQGLPSLTEVLQSRGGGVLSSITGLASTTLGVLINFVVVLVVGIFFASQPELYTGGIKHLLPFGYRPRAGEVFAVLDTALGRWLLGRFALMLVNVGLTALALWIIGVPLALTLGAIAGLLNFIPNFGPLIAAIPAILIAFTESPQLALYTALVYVVIQMVDGYVLTPLVDRESVELPPVVTIAAQVLLGVSFGFLGLLIASPLTAAFMILVKMLYVEDVLGDPIMRQSAVSEENGKQAGGSPKALAIRNEGHPTRKAG